MDPGTEKADRSPDNMRLLCLGLSRTGTAEELALKEALLHLGFANVYHQSTIFQGGFVDAPKWNTALEAKFLNNTAPLGKSDWDDLLGDYGAVLDVPAILLAEELMATYPSARVLITVRDSAAQWRESIHKTILRAYQSSDHDQAPPPAGPKASFVHMNNLVRQFHYRDFGGDLEQLYHEHNARIASLAAGRDLLVFNVKDGWAPLCRFLDLPVPSCPFPARNSTKDFVEAGKAYHDEHWLGSDQTALSS